MLYWLIKSCVRGPQNIHTLDKKLQYKKEVNAISTDSNHVAGSNIANHLAIRYLMHLLHSKLVKLLLPWLLFSLYCTGHYSLLRLHYQQIQTHTKVMWILQLA